jgi:hypothetical protein
VRKSYFSWYRIEIDALPRVRSTGDDENDMQLYI